MKLEISGVADSQRAAWDRARGFESFASWARRMLDAAALEGRGGLTVEAEHLDAESVPRPSSVGAGGVEGASGETAGIGNGIAGQEVGLAAPALDEGADNRLSPVSPDGEGQPVPGSTPGASIAKPADVPAAVEAVVGERKFVPDPKPGAAKKGASETAGGSMCEHRIVAPAHCKRCEEEKAGTVAGWAGAVGG